MRVLAHGGDSSRLAGLDLVWVEGEEAPRRVLSCQLTADRPILRLEGVERFEAADALRGRNLCVPATERPPLEEGRYYVDDLVGLSVRGADGDVYGDVIGVNPSPGHDLLEVRDASGRVHLLPAVRAFIRHVDLAGRVLTVDPIPGLLGIPERP